MRTDVGMRGAGVIGEESQRFEDKMLTVENQ